MTPSLKTARDKLESVGIEVLFGFYGSEGGSGWHAIKGDLSPKEGMVASGYFGSVKDKFNRYGPTARTSRMMDYGYFAIGFQFETTLREIKLGTANRDSGSPILQRVFSWTTTHKSNTYVHRLIGEGKVDGLIYGFKATHYYDHADTRQAAQIILNEVRRQPGFRRARNGDSLFGR